MMVLRISLGRISRRDGAVGARGLEVVEEGTMGSDSLRIVGGIWVWSVLEWRERVRMRMMNEVHKSREAS